MIGFKALSGAHSSENLGRYLVGLLDHVGIMDKTGSKASPFSCQNYIFDSHVTDQLYTATLDSTGNNNTTCKTIEDVHICRGLMWNSDQQQLPYVYLFSKFSH